MISRPFSHGALRLDPPDLGELTVGVHLTPSFGVRVRHGQSAGSVKGGPRHSRPPTTHRKTAFRTRSHSSGRDRPPFVRHERLNDMRPLPGPGSARHVPEVLKELPSYIPRPMQPRLAQLLAAASRAADSPGCRALSKTRLSVTNACTKLGLPPPPRLKPSVDEQPLKNNMGRPAGIQRVIRPLRNRCSSRAFRR